MVDGADKRHADILVEEAPGKVQCLSLSLGPSICPAYGWPARDERKVTQAQDFRGTDALPAFGLRLEGESILLVTEYSWEVGWHPLRGRVEEHERQFRLLALEQKRDSELDLPLRAFEDRPLCQDIECPWFTCNPVGVSPLLYDTELGLEQLHHTMLQWIA